MIREEKGSYHVLTNKLMTREGQVTCLGHQFSVLNCLHELPTEVCKLMKCSALYVLS